MPDEMIFVDDNDKTTTTKHLIIMMIRVCLHPLRLLCYYVDFVMPVPTNGCVLNLGP